jgi:hypothetical protein
LGLPPERYEDGGFTGANMERPAFVKFGVLRAEQEAARCSPDEFFRSGVDGSPCRTLN